MTVPADLPFLSLHGFPVDAGHAAWLRARFPVRVETAPTATH
ncbi:hypothetical protein J2S43_003406 [Catenuloplanes nepalensis]|uniref:Alpha/beta hydrolase n=1 Tax=Catenuloplanes nepalensis TaxID=587533 RepID=A0ABT9MTZ2_9ACTN|nr:hypothetical protein [Catenuloplanes nepalensis]